MGWAPRRGRRAGFTLIELMAVVLIIALASAIVLPNLAATRSSRLRDQARNLAARLELARERAIVTGAPHRVLIDLENGAYRIEWHVLEERAFRDPDEEEQEALLGGPAKEEKIDFSQRQTISLSPPTDEERAYYPIPNRFGTDQWLEPEYYFVGVETPEGWIERGEVGVVFQADGTTDFAEIGLADAWDNKVTLEVQPLLDQIRIHDDG